MWLVVLVKHNHNSEAKLCKSVCSVPHSKLLKIIYNYIYNSLYSFFIKLHGHKSNGGDRGIHLHKFQTKGMAMQMSPSLFGAHHPLTCNCLLSSARAENLHKISQCQQQQ